MKKILIFILLAAIFSGSLIFYAFQNIRMVQCSYRIQKKEKQLSVTSDRYKELSFELNQLQSLATLEARVADSQMDLIPPTDIKVIYNPIVIAPTYYAQNESSSSSPLLKGLEFVSEAHANASQQ